MKKWWSTVALACVLMIPSFAHAQFEKLLEGFLARSEQAVRTEDLEVVQLEFSPDPLREGQRITFRATVTNRSRQPGKVTLAVKDWDRVVSEARDVVLRPGDNQVDFPETMYRLSGTSRCFSLEANAGGTWTPLASTNEFCARKTYAGWTFGSERSAEVSVESLEMSPDPLSPGQEVRFRLGLRNDGRAMRGDVQILDGSEVVTQVRNASIPRGFTEIQFPRSQYAFRSFDTCFTVSVNGERGVSPVDLSGTSYCLRPVGWTLRAETKEEQRGQRQR